MERTSKQHVGNIGLKKINPTHRNAEIWVYIGATQNQRKGFAEAATRLLMASAFKKFHLHRLQAWMLENNVASYRLFKKCGFMEEGYLRDMFFFKNKFHSVRLVAKVQTGHRRRSNSLLEQILIRAFGLHFIAMSTDTMD